MELGPVIDCGVQAAAQNMQGGHGPLSQVAARGVRGRTPWASFSLAWPEQPPPRGSMAIYLFISAAGSKLRALGWVT